MPKEADYFMRRIQAKFGYDESLASRLRPIVVRAYEKTFNERQRRSILRLIAETYARQVKLKEALQKLRRRLRRRLNEIYAEQLGIEPPGI